MPAPALTKAGTILTERTTSAPPPTLPVARRMKEETMAQVLCMLYDDPVGRYPPLTSCVLPGEL